MNRYSYEKEKLYETEKLCKRGTETAVIRRGTIHCIRIAGGLLILMGGGVWFTGALRSDMDTSITENKLQTKGIYSWVRNPMYSGCWMMIVGTTFMWHNAWTLVLPLIDWAIMTIALINTEEKWLLDLYGKEYAEYKKRVNRCIPWFPKK